MFIFPISCAIIPENKTCAFGKGEAMMRIRRLCVVAVVILALALGSVSVLGTSIYPEALPDLDWDVPYAYTSSNINMELNTELNRHVYITNADSLISGDYVALMDTLWVFSYAAGYEPAGDQYLKYRSGELVRPVIEPYYYDDGKLIGERVHYIPRMDSFYIVSEFITTSNPHGAHYDSWNNATEYRGINSVAHISTKPTRTYDASGNFEYDKYVYPFEYAYKISAADFAAGYTAAKCAAGIAPPNVVPGSPADTPSDWAVDAVNTAMGENLIPIGVMWQYHKPITRLEFCMLAHTLYNKVMGEVMWLVDPFTDTVNRSVAAMWRHGIVTGVGGGKFDPDGLLTREQAATMLSRLASAIGKPLPKKATTFNDKATVSSWAADAVGQMQSSGIMGGVGENRFAPQEQYTREQSIVTMVRLFGLFES